MEKKLILDARSLARPKRQKRDQDQYLMISSQR